MKVKSFPGLIMPLMFALVVTFGCSKHNDSTDNKKDTTPEFLLKGWILPIASNVVRTYDFTQLQTAGKRSVEVREWQKAGTLRWQSNQQYNAVYEATDKKVVMTSATGYTETWEILGVEPTKIQVNLNGQQTYIFNCSEPGWPTMILESMRGCH
jgi:hypothetical protein